WRLLPFRPRRPGRIHFDRTAGDDDAIFDGRGFAGDESVAYVFQDGIGIPLARLAVAAAAGALRHEAIAGFGLVVRNLGRQFGFAAVAVDELQGRRASVGPA